MEFRRVDPGSDDLRDLIAAHLEHGAAATGEASNHTMGVQDLRQPGIGFWALYDGDRPVGCGALKPLPDGSAEVKSVHVARAARGRGLARCIMQHLAETARADGHVALVLETGSDRVPAYDAARALYETLGYEYCGPIPGYAPDPNSVFMRLGLDPAG